MQPILEVYNLSKCFQIRSTNTPRYLSLRDSLRNLLFNPKKKSEYLWALREVSFEAKPGERIAIIGKNGAGKSTLLKILSRISPPTNGKAIIRGRLASLLEVGTGFHPELTGRENILFNGSILGLKRAEIKQRFDAIVDFSGVGSFLETPLKFYSSGMQMRLAFAVAAFLEPEILFLDEVLAVGDAEFQKKSLQKMNEVAQSGRTILFVSHNMTAVRQLCSRGMVLEKGKIKFDGDIGKAVDYYLGEIKQNSAAIWVNNIEKPTKVFLEKIIISDAFGFQKTEFLSSEEIKIEFYTNAFENVSQFTIGFDLYRHGVLLSRSRQIDSIPKPKVLTGEKNIFACKIPAWFLHEGTYCIRPFLAIHFVEYLSNVHEHVELSIEVQLDASRSTLHGNLNQKTQPGLIFPMFEWSVI